MPARRFEAGSFANPTAPLRVKWRRIRWGSTHSFADIRMESTKDFFISFNYHDRAWAEWIAWTLEEKGYTTIIQSWDFLPGSNFSLEMKKGLDSARRMLAVLSPNYLSSGFAQAEWAAAFVRDPTGEKRILLPVRVAEVDLTPLDAAIVYIDLLHKTEAECQADLLKGVEEQARLKPSNKPAFPGLAKPLFPGSTISPPETRSVNSLQAAGFLLAFKKYATFRGRASRKEFWLFVLFNFIAANALGLLSGAVAAKTGHLEIAFAGPLLYYLATVIPTLAVTVRRLHDTSRSAWWLLITLVPFLGAIALAVLLALKGEEVDNRYGAKPAAAPQTPHSRARNNRRIVIAAALVLCAVVGVIVVLRQNSRNGKQASGLAPLGPIVQVPPAVLFRGATRPDGGSPGIPSQVDIAAAERDLNRHPDDPKVLNDLGCLLGASGDMARGHALLSQAHRLRPDDPDIGYNYARSLLQQGKLDEAGKEADRLVTQNPDSAEARLLKATIAVQNRDYPAAQEQVTEVLKNGPELSNQTPTGTRGDKVTQTLKAIQMSALVIQGVIYLAKGRTQQGLASFQAALKLGPDPAAAYNAGVTYQQLGKPAQAAPYYQRAIEAQPSLAEAHHNLGGLMLAEKDLSGAQRELNAAATLRPDLLPSIQTAFEAADKPDRQTTGLIAWTELVRSVQNAIARLSGKKAMTLQEAVKNGMVNAVGQVAANIIRVRFNKTAQAGPGVLELTFPPGSILESGTSLYSDLVITRAIGRETIGQRYIPGPLSLADSEPVVYAFDGYLAAPKQAPPEGVAFSVAKTSPDPALACIAGQNRLPAGIAVQFAIWIQTQRFPAGQWQQLRQRLKINDTDWSAVESLVTQCKTQAH
jgi:uncharacterized membrane protein YhaH (DUF805 family)/Flp pilus assembly protein TadD